MFCASSVDTQLVNICSCRVLLYKLSNKVVMAPAFPLLQHPSSVMSLQLTARKGYASSLRLPNLHVPFVGIQPTLRIWAYVSAGRVHSKTRAGVAALAACQAHQPQALPAGDNTINTQQQHRVSALLKQSSSDCSTAFSVLRHACAGTKRSQEAAALPTADPAHMPFKPRRVDPVLPSSPSQAGTCRKQHALTQRAAEAIEAPALGLDASPPSSVCQTPAAISLSAYDSCTNGCLECQLGSSCQLQTANCQQTCRGGLHAPMHRQSSRAFACDWAATSSCMNPSSSGSTTFLACVKSEAKGEEDTHYQAGLLLPGPEYAQQLDKQQSAGSGTSKTAAASRQQHKLHMIDLMLARVSAAEEAIHLRLAQPNQSDSCFQSHHDPWAPVESCNKLLRNHKVQSGTPGEGIFSGIESLLLCDDGQQSECKMEQFAVMDNSQSNTKGAILLNGPDDMLQGCTERTHSSSESSFDCPGRFLVPNDWLIEGSDEVDLNCFSIGPNDNYILGPALPLMPPLLQH